MTKDVGGVDVEYQDCVGFAELRAFKCPPEAPKATEPEAMLGAQVFIAPWLELMPHWFIAEMLYMAADELIELAKEFGPRKTEDAEVIKIVDRGPA